MTFLSCNEKTTGVYWTVPVLIRCQNVQRLLTTLTGVLDSFQEVNSIPRKRNFLLRISPFLVQCKLNHSDQKKLFTVKQIFATYDILFVKFYRD